MTATVAELSGRALLAVGGADAETFLDRLVTVDVDRLVPGRAGYGALLTPQGKILTDFLISRDGGGFLLDLPATTAADFAKRLTLYRLRAAVTFALDAPARVLAGWDGAPPDGGDGSLVVTDARADGLGWRAYRAPSLAPTAAEADWQRHRLVLGVPELGADFVAGDTFPHEVAMDQLSGVAFDKGCYVGQEVVSRMEHRGTARRRPVRVHGERDLPSGGTELVAGERPLGRLGSTAGPEGLAIVRLDRAREAMDGGVAILAGDVPVTLALPAYAHYTWPDGASD